MYFTWWRHASRFTAPLCGESTDYQWSHGTNGQYRIALVVSMLLTWMRNWTNSEEAGAIGRLNVHVTSQSSTSILSPCSHGGNWRRIRCHAFKAPQLPWWTAPATLQPQVKGYSHYLYHGNLYHTGLILGLRPANERRRYFVTTSLIGWAQAILQP